MVTDRQRFLPIGKHDVVDLCAADPRLPVGDRPAFRDFCRIVESVFHFEFHARLEHLKRCHAPFDPDRPAAPLCPPTDTERPPAAGPGRGPARTAAGDRAWFDGQRRRDLPFVPGATVLKLFRNVPAADLEMLFPNTEVRIKPLDMLLIGVLAAVGGIVVWMTKLLGTLLLLGSLLAFWLGLRAR